MSTASEIISSATLIVVALISATGAVLVAYLGKKINEVHVMVNSNLAQARVDREVAVQELATVNKANAERMNARISELLAENTELHEKLNGRA